MPEISSMGLVATAVLLLACAGFTQVLSLGLFRPMVIAAIRTTLQLLLLGWALGWIFSSRSLGWSGLAILLMTAVATHAAVGRVPFRYKGMSPHVFTAIAVVCWGLSIYATFVILPTKSWQEPSIVLPFVGLLLGNCLSGISLGLAHWVRELRNHQERVDFWLSHGASRWEAVRHEFRDSIKTAMTPVLNSMTVAGVVSLPGMMTGQLLAGANPSSAVRYQIAVMFLVALGTLLGTGLAVLFAFLSLFNERHQFVADRLESFG